MGSPSKAHLAQGATNMADGELVIGVVREVFAPYLVGRIDQNVELHEVEPGQRLTDEDASSNMLPYNACGETLPTLE